MPRKEDPDKIVIPEKRMAKVSKFRMDEAIALIDEVMSPFDPAPVVLVEADPFDRRPAMRTMLSADEDARAYVRALTKSRDAEIFPVKEMTPERKATYDQMREFLTYYLATFEPTRAAVESGVDPFILPTWRRIPAFDKLYRQCQTIVYEKLESEAVRRAHAGSDKLMVKMLEAYMPEKFGRQQVMRMLGSGANGEIEVSVKNWRDLAASAATPSSIRDVYEAQEAETRGTRPVEDTEDETPKTPWTQDDEADYVRTYGRASPRAKELRKLPVDGPPAHYPAGRVLPTREGVAESDLPAAGSRGAHVSALDRTSLDGFEDDED